MGAENIKQRKSQQLTYSFRLLIFCDTLYQTVRHLFLYFFPSNRPLLLQLGTRSPWGRWLPCFILVTSLWWTQASQSCESAVCAQWSGVVSWQRRPELTCAGTTTVWRSSATPAEKLSDWCASVADGLENCTTVHNQVNRISTMAFRWNVVCRSVNW